MTTHQTSRTRGPDWNWSDVRALCLREARRVLGPSTAADDAAQEAAIRAWRQRACCRTPSRPGPWLATIARREALRVLSQRREQPLGDAVEQAAEAGVPELESLSALDLRRALRTMDGQDVQLLVGRYWQDLTYSELAEQFGVAEATVRVRLHRLRLRLRDILVER
jgi:RNA polymerase sigma-70 factor (ECF subfamily)